MNKEEKEAIEKLNSIVKVHKDYMQGVNEETINEKEIKAIEIVLNLINKLQKENKQLKRVKEQSQKILSSIKIIYQVHTKDCELTLKDIKKWEKILDK